MLKQELIDAVAAGKFHIYPVKTVDQGISVLTGTETGERHSIDCTCQNIYRPIAGHSREIRCYEEIVYVETDHKHCIVTDPCDYRVL